MDNTQILPHKPLQAVVCKEQTITELAVQASAALVSHLPSKQYVDSALDCLTEQILICFESENRSCKCLHSECHCLVES